MEIWFCGVLPTPRLWERPSVGPRGKQSSADQQVNVPPAARGLRSDETANISQQQHRDVSPRWRSRDHDSDHPLSHEEATRTARRRQGDSRIREKNFPKRGRGWHRETLTLFHTLLLASKERKASRPLGIFPHIDWATAWLVAVGDRHRSRVSGCCRD